MMMAAALAAATAGIAQPQEAAPKQSAAPAPAPVPAPAAPRCRFTLQGAQVWTGERFEARTLHVDGARFVAEAPAGAAAMPAMWMFLIPPLVDTHTHGLDEPAAANDPMHRANLQAGIYYALNPNNIRRATPGAPFGPDQVEALYAGGGITGPGGHPRPLYEMLARLGQQRGFDMGPLPGRAFHEVSTEAETRAAVERVQAQGASVVKLYLLFHDGADSKGLSAALFRTAVAHAQRRGLRPIVHVETASDFRLAAGTRGVGAIVHMPGAFPQLPDDAVYQLTAEDAALTARNGISVSTTTAVAFNHTAGERLARAQRINAHNLRLLRDANVNLTAGADRPGATAVDELNLLRATTLFDGTQLLNIATRNGLKLVFPDRRIGTFEPGSEASFLIMFADPRNNWFWLDDALGGMRGGHVISDQTGMLRGLCGGGARPAQ
jgi:imidazolonepropionase-like amidohydrolase